MSAKKKAPKGEPVEQADDIASELELPEAWDQQHEAYCVGVDDSFFLSYSGDDWTDNAMWAKRFKKPNQAQLYVQDVQKKFPEKRVRLLKCYMSFVFGEVE